METCMTPSSVDSAASNFTVISGVSPLPVSDPSLHKHHKHHHKDPHHKEHHHHKHHHKDTHYKEHHHHHTHHREHHKEHHCKLELVRARENVLTSTPIYRKKIVDDVVCIYIFPSNVAGCLFLLYSDLKRSHVYHHSFLIHIVSVLGRTLR